MFAGSRWNLRSGSLRSKFQPYGKEVGLGGCWGNGELIDDQSDVCGRDLMGFNSPEINGQQARAGNDGFLSGSRTGLGSRSQDVSELLDAPPLRVPAHQSPHRLYQDGSDAGVAHAVNGPLASSARAAVLTGTTTDETADLSAVFKAIPVQDLGLELSAGGQSESPGLLAILLPGLAPKGTEFFEFPDAGFDLENNLTVGFEHGHEPGIEFGAQFGPETLSPPAFGDGENAVLEEQGAAMGVEHVEGFYQLHALTPKSTVTFLFGGGNAHDFEGRGVCPLNEVDELGAEGQGVNFVGFAFAVEDFGSDHQRLHAQSEQVIVELITETTGFLNAVDLMALLAKRAKRLEDALSGIFSQVEERAAVETYSESCSRQFDVQAEVENSAAARTELLKFFPCAAGDFELVCFHKAFQNKTKLPP